MIVRLASSVWIILAFLAAVLSAQQPTNRGFDYKINDNCGEIKPWIEDAILDLRDAVHIAERRMYDLVADLEADLHEVIAKSLNFKRPHTGLNVSTLNLYNTLFPKLEECYQLPNVRDFHSRIERFRNKLNDPTYRLDIQCSEDFLQPSRDDESIRFDSRPRGLGGQRLLQLPQGTKRICDTPNPIPLITGEDVRADALVICDSVKEKIQKNRYERQPLGTVSRGLRFNDGEHHIKTLAEGKIAFNFIYSLSSSLVMFRCSGDVEGCKPEKSGQTSWEDSVKLAHEKPFDAFYSQANFAYFIFGLTFSNNDWSGDGLSKPLPMNQVGPIASLIWEGGKWTRPNVPPWLPIS